MLQNIQNKSHLARRIEKKKKGKKEKHLLAFSGLHGHVTQDLPPSIAVVKSQQLDLLWSLTYRLLFGNDSGFWSLI